MEWILTNAAAPRLVSRLQLCIQMKRLLLLSNTTGYQAQMFRDAARQLEVPLALATDRCHVLEDPWGDDAIAVRFQEPVESAKKVVELARRNPLNGVIAIGDAPTMTAALAAQELGLPFHSPQAVEACRNKYLARQLFRAAGLAVPWYRRLPADEDPSAATGVPFPCVLKPLGLSGSRGVIRADNPGEFEAAFRRIGRLLEAADVQVLKEESSRWIQVESFIPGREFALEGIMSGGELRVLALFDKPDPLDGPFFEETIYVTPSRLPQGEQEALVTCARRAVRALGLWHGPVHAELRLNPEGAWMLEVAARPIGGLCAATLRFKRPPLNGDRLKTGAISLEELIVRHALGEPIDTLPRETAASGVMMIPIPQAGIYEGVENLEEAGRVSGIERIEITAKQRQKLVPLPEGSSYLGFIFARGPWPGMVEQALREAHQKLRFIISPDLPLVKAG